MAERIDMRGTKMTYEAAADKWNSEAVRLRVESEPFQEGGMRLTWSSLKARRARRHEYVAAYVLAHRKKECSEEVAALRRLESSMDFDEITTFRRIAASRSVSPRDSSASRWR